MTVGRQCRICLTEESKLSSKKSMLSPCECSGSMKYVHKRCLERWMEEKYLNSRSNLCEICRAPLRNTKKRRHSIVEQIRRHSPHSTTLITLASIIGVYVLYFSVLSGNLRIVIHSGVLSDSVDPWPFNKADGYVDICIDGFCGCRTDVVHDTKEPQWNAVCRQWSDKSVFVFSKLSLVIYDYDVVNDDTLGNIEISIPWLLFRGWNGKPVEYIWDDPEPGAVTVTVTWTMNLFPKNPL